MSIDIDNLRKRLIYRSQYRGTKEMDKLIGSFVHNYINRLDDQQLKELENFLEIDDDILYKFYNNQIIETKFVETDMVKLFKQHVYRK